MDSPDSPMSPSGANTVKKVWSPTSPTKATTNGFPGGDNEVSCLPLKWNSFVISHCYTLLGSESYRILLWTVKDECFMRTMVNSLDAPWVNRNLLEIEKKLMNCILLCPKFRKKNIIYSTCNFFYLQKCNVNLTLFKRNF